MLKKIITVLTAAFLFTSCGIPDAVNKKIDKAKEKVKEKVSEAEEKFSDKMEDIYGESSLDEGKRIAKEVGQNVLTAIQNEDVDALADMFCQYTVDEYGDDLKPEIQNLYDYIDGEIVSHDEIETRSNAAKMTAEDGPVIFSYHAIIENVITDKGNKYKIGCTGYSVYKNHPELVGFVRLFVLDKNKNEYVIENYDLKDIDNSMYSYKIGELPEKPLV